MIASQLPVRCGRLTVARFLGDWLEVTRQRVRPSTIVNYELNVRRLSDHLGLLPLTRLNPPRIQASYDALANGGLSAYSVLQAHRTLSRALSQAMHWGLIPRNPAATPFPPKPQPRETEGPDCGGAARLDQEHARRSVQRTLAGARYRRTSPR